MSCLAKTMLEANSTREGPVNSKFQTGFSLTSKSNMKGKYVQWDSGYCSHIEESCFVKLRKGHHNLRYVKRRWPPQEKCWQIWNGYKQTLNHLYFGIYIPAWPKSKWLTDQCMWLKGWRFDHKWQHPQFMSYLAHDTECPSIYISVNQRLQILYKTYISYKLYIFQTDSSLLALIFVRKEFKTTHSFFSVFPLLWGGNWAAMPADIHIMKKQEYWTAG